MIILNKRIEILLQHKKFKDAEKLVNQTLSGMDKSKTHNWIEFSKFLRYEIGNTEKYKKFQKPLLRKLRIQYSEFEQSIVVIEELNDAYFQLDNILSSYFNKYFQFDYYNVIWHILLDYEVMIKGQDNVSICGKNVLMSRGEERINHLSFLLKLLHENEVNFTKKAQFSSDRSRAISRLERISKKVTSTVDVDNAIDKIITLNRISEISKTSDVSVSNTVSRKIYEFRVKFSDYEKSKYLSRLRLNAFDTKYLKIISGTFLNRNKWLEYPSNFIVEHEYGFLTMFDFSNAEAVEFARKLIEEKLDNFEFVYDSNYINRDNIDNNVILGQSKLKFSYLDLITFYCFIVLLSYIQFDSEVKFIKNNNKNSYTSIVQIDYDKLRCYAYGFFYHYVDKKFDANKLDDIIEYYTFGHSNIYDLSYQPLIKNGDKLFILPSVVLNTNIQRTFLSYISIQNGNFKSVSFMEEYVSSMFEEHQFQVYKDGKRQLNFDYDGKKGDIDLLAIKDNTLYFAQLKNRHQPLDDNEFLNFDRKLKKVAIKQLEHAKEYIKSNPKHILQAMGRETFSDLELVPLIITNAFYRSGECIDGVNVIDMSSLHKLFDDGFVKKQVGNLVKEFRLRETNVVSNNDLMNMIENPYFFNQEIYNTQELDKEYGIELTI